jgi:hypothetical protein
MHAPSEAELTVDILGYILEHPDAADEAEGILAWWFSAERMRVGLAKVQQILENLAKRDLIIEHRMPGGRVMYSLNKERMAEIARFIGQKTE